jgi:phosphoserine phosphatase
MASIVVLIADPATAPLDAALVAALARALKGAPVWLAEAEAVEIESGLTPGEALARAGAIVGAARVDLAALPPQRRQKRLLIADMDSTVITVECIDELADFAGIKAEVAAITRRAMNGELDFRSALTERVALLRGLPEGVLEEVWRERVRLMPGARTLVRTMKARGAVTALVSGGFDFFTGRVRQEAGFDHDLANRLEMVGGRLTGRLVGPVLDQRDKLRALERLLLDHGLSPLDALAVGDGANDLPMLAAAGLGVAFRAHPRVAAATAVNVRHGDLTALLYLQGIARRDFVAA